MLAIHKLIVAITPFFAPYLVNTLKPKALITLPESVRNVNLNTKIYFAKDLHAKIYFTKRYVFLSSANLTKFAYKEITLKVEREPELDALIINSLPLEKEEHYYEILSVL